MLSQHPTNLFKEYAAFAGLVDGSFTAFLPIFEKQQVL